ncbi:hypothetical protein BOW53_09820 [Solemya pervernicosa gill symbiont]|uniref:cyclic-guanylate-specific phosphodiesterase n=2 Tax=Gammaproteobacteria incertae sedis TaxID=118884 RepID=A0A1T2L4A0_9GAMM|nr:EAL domain-containing protein [Candidatus Reidiella endopervernicosa]OOZ39891.1 hypothetical protein BOW53_09820 [Solemya pervernicosa gill symbiont]QKQ25785.1 EAL domain-containing protein [Candidatus Reidiella endopervernicosa]
MDNQRHHQTFSHDEVIFCEGDQGDVAYLVERGQIEISTQVDDRKLVVAVLQKGELFGEMALIDDSLRSATATALGEVDLAIISREYVSNKMNNADPLINLLLRVILQRFRKLQCHDNGAVVEDQKTNEYFEKFRESAVQRLKMEQELQEAIEQRHLVLYYQPIVSTATGYIGGFEALVRWNHPERGMVPPDQFIPLAEECGLIVPLGLWVLQEACNTHVKMQSIFKEHHPHMPPLYMSINASGRQFADQHFIDDIRATLDESGADPTEIKIEITETMLMEDPKHAIKQLLEIKSLDLRLALDDFGTGYSSLSYLQHFPIDTLKIDRAFVSTMLKDPRCMAIVDSLIGLAHNLGMDIIAEGVEEVPEFHTLRDAKCEYNQGYLFSRPRPQDEALELLVQGNIPKG